MTTTFEAPATTISIATRLRDWAHRDPGGVALREKRLGVWHEITWQAYWDLVQDVAHAFLSLGVEPGDRVAIHSENRPEWVVCDVACVAVRAVSMGVYPTNPAAEVEYLLDNSGAKILVAEDQEQVDKALAVADRLPHLERIVYVDPRGVRRYDDPRLLAWEDLLAMGRRHRAAHAGEVERLMSQARPDDLATLVYTSGTTGPPKGAMLTVANVEFAITSAVVSGALADPPPGQSDMLLSYLPLAHVAERLFTVWFNLGAGPVVNFAESIETVQQNLREIQPTIFLGVPRIWEKMHAGIEIRMANASRLKRANYRFWVARGLRLVDKDLAGARLTPLDRVVRLLGHLLLYRALKDRIGMRCCRFAASGAAPVAPDLLRFFMAIGVPMHEAYGMTENSAVATSNRPGRVKLGTVGEPYPGAEVRVDPATGEIQTRHPGNFAGYWRNEQATRETFTEDGWLRTGDVGEWVDGTHLKITDRLKDIIITAGGKNISPSELENALKTSPYIKEAVVLGDRRPYLTALIGIELDTVGDWATRQGIPYTTYRDLSEKPEVLALVRKEIDRTNARFAQVETIKKFRMLPKELDHEDGELTATQKVKRAAISRQFSDLVEAMYQ
ncbi:MAG TPA: AMP-binding protein [Egibacteraceae bacterium]|nr:AMP-binding protein [Egibacteraceae bacterium]